MSHDLTKAWSTAIGDIKYLICHMTSQKHMTEGSSNVMSGSSSFYFTTSPSFVAMSIAVVEIQCFSLPCNQSKHVIKGSGDYADSGPSR